MSGGVCVAGTSAQTMAYVQAHLDDDMELLAAQQPPPIQPALHNNNNGTASSSSCVLVLQVVAVQDVSQSLEQHLRALAPAGDEHRLAQRSHHGEHDNDNDDDNDDDDDADDTPAATTTSARGRSAAAAALQAAADMEAARVRQRCRRAGGGQWRYVRLVLTDGYTRLLAVEDRRSVTAMAPLLLPDGVALGAKLHIRLARNNNNNNSSCHDVDDDDGGAVWTHGVLRLHGGNTRVLGGCVRALQVFCQQLAQEQLAKMEGRPGALTTTTTTTSRSEHNDHTTADRNNNNNTTHAATTTAADTSRPLACQPLSAWPAHMATQPHAPFATRAVITSVLSDLLIHEYTTTTTATATSAAAAGTQYAYSLIVELSPADDDGDDASGAHALAVDLGNELLCVLLGVPAAALHALQSRHDDAHAAQRVAALREHLGRTLEHYGVAAFVLQQRASDGVIEVLAAQQQQQ